MHMGIKVCRGTWECKVQLGKYLPGVYIDSVACNICTTESEDHVGYDEDDKKVGICKKSVKVAAKPQPRWSLHARHRQHYFQYSRTIRKSLLPQTYVLQTWKMKLEKC